MEKRIQLEKRGRKETQIVNLNLDNCKSPHIVGLSDEYKNLETLSLINVGLTTLKGFPKLPKLKNLELSDNRISTGLSYLENSPNLTYLNLSGNKIKDFDELKPLEKFKKLAVLDLFNNEVISTSGYIMKVFSMIPSLKYLDGFDVNCEEAQSDSGEEEEVLYTENESEYDDEDCSLAYVYKEDLDDDSSEYEAEEEEDDADDDLIDEESDAENDDNDKSTCASTAAEESENPAQQARGKKRKHEGE